MFPSLLRTAACPFRLLERALLPFTRTCLCVLVLVSVGVRAQWPSYEAVSKRLSDRCEYGEFDCALGDVCIPLSKFRDGQVDCLDGSDEFCYPGHVKCGSMCVELQHLGECLANPRCENITTMPVYCQLLKTKICHFEDALPCKGYGECVLRKWLSDGHKDCFDGSDEDLDYVRLLTSCLYPLRSTSASEENFKNGFVEITKPSLPGSSGSPWHSRPTPSANNNQYPGGGGSYGTKRPGYPWEALPSAFPPQKPEPSAVDTLIPINPFVRGPLTTPRPAGEGSVGVGGNYGEDVYGNRFPDFGHNGVATGVGGDQTGQPAVSTLPRTEPPNPFVDVEEHGTGTPQPTPMRGTAAPDESPWYTLSPGQKIGVSPGSIPSVNPEGEVQYPFTPPETETGGITIIPIPWDPHRIGPFPTAGNWRPATPPPFSPFPFSEFRTRPHFTKPTPAVSTEEVDSWIISPVSHPTHQQHITTTSPTLPPHPTATAAHGTRRPHPTPSRLTPSESPLITTMNEVPTAITETPIAVGAHGALEANPYHFVRGIDLTRVTTSRPPPNMNCTEKVKQAASELVPSPVCSCPAGEMLSTKGECLRAEVSTFRARLMHICGFTPKDVANEAQVLAYKLSTVFDLPMCVRKTGDVIVFNTVCNGCEFTDLIDRYAASSDLSEVDLKLSEIPRSACYEFSMNDCDEKAECVPEGMRYKCVCLPGTNDTVDGSGRHCDGVVIANQCAMLLGVCVLFWILLLLLLCVLLPLILFFCSRYCRKKNTKIFDRFAIKKKTEVLPTVRPSNAEVNVTTLKPVVEPSAGAQWDGANIAAGKVGIPTITTTIPSTARLTPLNTLLPADEYCIIENDDEEDGESVKGDAASIGASSDSTTVLNKAAAASVVAGAVAAVAGDQSRPTSRSRSATPTIWETYQILGQQYTRFSSAKRRKSSSHSLEALIKKRQEEELRQRTAVVSSPDVDLDANAALPPKPNQTKKLARHDSNRSHASRTSRTSEQSAKLAEMLGTTISEEPAETVANATTAEIMSSFQMAPEVVMRSIANTPDIIKAAESTVTDALRNVIGPQFEQEQLGPAPTRLQTSTKTSPTGSREDLPVIGDVTTTSPPIVATSAFATDKVMSHTGTPRPGSSASTRSRSTLPNPTIEPTPEEITRDLDQVAEALAQLPSIAVPMLPTREKAPTAKTQPSSARSKKTSVGSGSRTARSLSSDVQKMSESPKSARKTLSSEAKEKPIVERRKPSVKPKRTSTSSERPLPPLKEMSPSPVRKPSVPAEAKRPARPKPMPPTGTPKELPKKLPPIPTYQRQASTLSIKSKRGTSNPPTRQLSNISEKSEKVSTAKGAVSKSTSLPSTARKVPRVSPLKKTDSFGSGSKLPKLVDPKSGLQSAHCRYDEPDYIMADLDLDLPGPFMLPTSSVEDLRNVGLRTSKLPRLKQAQVSQSAPSTERQGKKTHFFARQQSTKSDEFWKSGKLPPIDVDLDDGVLVDVDTGRVERTATKQPTATIARKIASRKAAGLSGPHPTPKHVCTPVYEYKRPQSYGSHVHDGCVKNQPPWDFTPLREGEMEKIPLDWNLSRSSSLISLTERRTQSFTDLPKQVSVKVLSARSANVTGRSKVDSNSLTNIFHFQARVRGVEEAWVEDLKKSLKQTNSWLDYD